MIVQRVALLIFVLGLFGSLPAQKNGNWKKEVRQFQRELNAQYRDPEDSPLEEADRIAFRRHHFYPINKKMRFRARIERTPASISFEMPTSAGVTKTFRQWAILHFEYAGEPRQISAYVRIDAEGEPMDYLFIPFKDYTSGGESYGGGRYIDARIPPSEEGGFWLDFNQAYNPYCAYSGGWSCPIPPEENNLGFEVRAGVKDWGRH